MSSSAPVMKLSFPPGFAISIVVAICTICADCGTLTAQVTKASFDDVFQLGASDRFGEVGIRADAKADIGLTGGSVMFSDRKQQFPYIKRHHGFFCEIESKIEKKSAFSPRFRLGSAAYVDYLEGKSMAPPTYQ